MPPSSSWLGSTVKAILDHVEVVFVLEDHAGSVSIPNDLGANPTLRANHRDIATQFLKR